MSLQSYYDTLPDERSCTYFDGLRALNYGGITWNYTGPVTLEWEQFVATPADMRPSVLVQYGAATDSRLLVHSPWEDGVIYADYGVFSANKARISAPYTDFLGRWARVKFQSDGNNAGGGRRLYINDVLVAELAESQGPTGTLTGLAIGERSGGTTFWKGYIRNYKAWQGNTLKTDILFYGTTPLLERVSGVLPVTTSGNVSFVTK